MHNNSAEDKEYTEVFVWGLNGYGQLGLGSNTTAIQSTDVSYTLY